MTKEKFVLIGAGSAQFTRGLMADLVSRGEEVELALVDIDADALAVAEGLCGKMVEARKAPIRLTAATDRRDVLSGATVVICTISVGGRRGREKDVFIPRKYGIFQPVGDTVMPGGSSYALRMIPPMVAIAEDVLGLAPNALFFNYGNPMGAVCRGVRKATGAQIVGLCHGVPGVAGGLARELGVPVSRLGYSAVGMNHLTWFTHVRVNGQDAMPRLQEIAGEKLAGGPRKGRLGGGYLEGGRWKPPDEPPVDIHPFSWQLLQTFGAFPAVGDRHVCEFFPHLFAKEGAYFGKTLGVDAYSFENSMAYGDGIYKEMREIALSSEPLGEDYFQRIGGEHKQVMAIIDSVRQEAGRVYSTNLPNCGQVPNLPPEAVLECPAVADGAGLRPITLPPLPSGIVGTLATRLAWVETVVEAALEGSRQKFIQALLLDGAASSVEMATELADELLAAHADLLPRFSDGSRLRPTQEGKA